MSRFDVTFQNIFNCSGHGTRMNGGGSIEGKKQQMSFLSFALSSTDGSLHYIPNGEMRQNQTVVKPVNHAG